MANPSLKVVIWPAWPFARKGGVNPLRDNNKPTQWPQWQLPIIESQNCQNQTKLKETEEFMRIEWEKKNRLNVFQNIVSWPKTLFKNILYQKSFLRSQTNYVVSKRHFLARYSCFGLRMKIDGGAFTQTPVCIIILWQALPYRSKTERQKSAADLSGYIDVCVASICRKMCNINIR